MRLEQFEYIISVANAGSMHIASNSLHISQQNISKAIKQLEDELDIKIFNRTNRGVTLTIDGQKVYSYALMIMQNINAIKNEFSLTVSDQSVKGDLKLYFASGLSNFIDGLIKSLYISFPTLNPIIIEQDTFAILDALPEVQPEIVFLQLSMNDLLDSTYIRAHYRIYLIQEEPLQVLMGPESKYVNYQSISLKTLSQLPLVINTDSTHKPPIYMKTLSNMNIPLQVKFITNSTSSMLSYISSNMAYGLVTQTTSKTLPQNLNLRIVPIKEKVLLAFVLLVGFDETLSPQSRIFCNKFQEIYAGNYQQLY